MDKIEDDIEEDTEVKLKDLMNEKFNIKTVPKCKNILWSEIGQGLYKLNEALMNGCSSSILNILFLRI